MNAPGVSASPTARLFRLADRAAKALRVRRQERPSKGLEEPGLRIVSPNVLVNDDWYGAMYGEKRQGGLMIVGCTPDGNVMPAYLP